VDLVWGIYGLPTPQTEVRFHPKRKWCFDYAWPDLHIAVEIEGAVWVHGRHTRGSGFTQDMEKYNEAGKLGYRVFRFTPQQLKSGEAQAFMKELFTI